MKEEPLYAEVLLPLAVPKTYTYTVPAELQDSAKTGKRAIVGFGKNKLYSAVIVSIHKNKPSGFEPKAIIEIIDTSASVSPLQIKFWNWMSDYYMCTAGEVMNAALPAGMKCESETILFYNDAQDMSDLSADEQELIETVIHNNGKKNSFIQKQYRGKRFFSVLKNLIEKTIIVANEKITSKPIYKSEVFLSLNKKYRQESEIHLLLDSLTRKAPKQYNAVMVFLDMSASGKDVAQKELQKKSGCDSLIINTLIKKGVFTSVFKEKISRSTNTVPSTAAAVLSEDQEASLSQIRGSFRNKNVVLLHGITSSGKTEIYIHLIKEQISRGKQVLYMLPEIAITSQMVTRLKNIFGEKIGIYHSRFSDTHRLEIWNRLLKKQKNSSESYDIILGVRSSVFLPFTNLGLIIVDEEHDYSYKQNEPSPRYHARDAAIVLAALHDAKVLLGSATPAAETYYNAHSQKYGFVELNTRYKNITPPEITIINIRDEYRKRRMHSRFSKTLIDAINSALVNKEQVILFQNRRGHSLYMQCEECGTATRCKRCDVSMIYHRSENILKCHYCGFTSKPSVTCPSCNTASVKMHGFGTEQIEDEISILFPEARTVRLDMDTAGSRKKHEEIISAFENHEADILVGTQMISKGFDFGNVSTVGIINADNMLLFPDFRSYERGFQLMLQVSGRAGRMNKQGKVFIQTSQPEDDIFKKIVSADYKSFFNGQAAERKMFSYPPYCRLIKIALLHRNPELLDAAAEKLSDELRKIEQTKIIGPEYHYIPRIKNIYHKNILIKISRSKPNYGTIKQKIKDCIKKLTSHSSYKSVRTIIDVDPI